MISIGDLCEHIRSVVIPQLAVYVGRNGQKKLQNWTTEIVSQKATNLEYITDNEVIGMIKIVGNPNKDKSSDSK